TVTNLAKPDAARRWAFAHGMKLKGHALLWHLQTPAWFTTLQDRAAALRALQGHIQTMCGHFAGSMQSWDVVNEPLEIGDRADGLRMTPFMKQIGPEYLDDAFRTAREADGKALLLLNENSLEYDVPDQRAKRRAMLNLIDGFKRRNTPLDAV